MCLNVRGFDDFHFSQDGGKPFVAASHVVHQLRIPGFCRKLASVNTSYPSRARKDKRLVWSGLLKAKVNFEVVGIHLEGICLHDYLNRQSVYVLAELTSQ